MMAGERRRQAARKAIEDLRAKAVGGELTLGPGGCYGSLVQGPWTKIGLPTWASALDLEVDNWSKVVEEVGHFVIFRVLEREEGPVPQATRFTLDVLRAPYIEPDAAAIERRYDSTRLTIVDPEWLEIFPEHYLYRMGVRD